MPSQKPRYKAENLQGRSHTCAEGRTWERTVCKGPACLSWKPRVVWAWWGWGQITQGFRHHGKSLDFILSAKRQPLILLPCGERTRVTQGSRKLHVCQGARGLVVAWPAYTLSHPRWWKWDGWWILIHFISLRYASKRDRLNGRLIYMVVLVLGNLPVPFLTLVLAFHSPALTHCRVLIT